MEVGWRARGWVVGWVGDGMCECVWVEWWCGRVWCGGGGWVGGVCGSGGMGGSGEVSRVGVGREIGGGRGRCWPCVGCRPCVWTGREGMCEDGREGGRERGCEWEREGVREGLCTGGGHVDTVVDVSGSGSVRGDGVEWMVGRGGVGWG